MVAMVLVQKRTVNTPSTSLGRSATGCPLNALETRHRRPGAFALFAVRYAPVLLLPAPPGS